MTTTDIYKGYPSFFTTQPGCCLWLFLPHPTPLHLEMSSMLCIPAYFQVVATCLQVCKSLSSSLGQLSVIPYQTTSHIDSFTHTSKTIGIQKLQVHVIKRSRSRMFTNILILLRLWFSSIKLLAFLICTQLVISPVLCLQ